MKKRRNLGPGRGNRSEKYNTKKYRWNKIKKNSKNIIFEKKSNTSKTPKNSKHTRGTFQEDGSFCDEAPVGLGESDRVYCSLFNGLCLLLERVRRVPPLSLPRPSLVPPLSLPRPSLVPPSSLPCPSLVPPPHPLIESIVVSSMAFICC
jgi:hypothetical protein